MRSLVRPQPLRFLLLPLALACASAGCGPAAPQAKAPPSCKAQCQAAHDKCVVNARTEPAVHGCDNDEAWCVNHCGT